MRPSLKPDAPTVRTRSSVMCSYALAVFTAPTPLSVTVSLTSTPDLTPVTSTVRAPAPAGEPSSSASVETIACMREAVGGTHTPPPDQIVSVPASTSKLSPVMIGIALLEGLRPRRHVQRRHLCARHALVDARRRVERVRRRELREVAHELDALALRRRVVVASLPEHELALDAVPVAVEHAPRVVQRDAVARRADVAEVIAIDVDVTQRVALRVVPVAVEVLDVSDRARAGVARLRAREQRHVAAVPRPVAHDERVAARRVLRERRPAIFAIVVVAVRVDVVVGPHDGIERARLHVRLILAGAPL